MPAVVPDVPASFFPQVADLNKNPKLPYGDSEFDFVTNVVSVDYLVKPQEVGVRMGQVIFWSPINEPRNGWSSS